MFWLLMIIVTQMFDYGLKLQGFWQENASNYADFKCGFYAILINTNKFYRCYCLILYKRNQL